MADSGKIRGETGPVRPFGPEQPRETGDIDSDKFKKILKVDESDQSQKKHKRKLKKEEEEGDDEKSVKETPQQPSTSFAEFMDDKEELDNLFDAQSAGIQKRVVPKEQPPLTAPPPGYAPKAGIGEEEGGKVAATPQYETPPTPAAPKEKPPPPTAAPPKAQPPIGAPPKEEVDTSLLATQPKKGELEASIKKKAPAKKVPIIEEIPEKGAPPKAVEKEMAKVEMEKALTEKKEEALPQVSTKPSETFFQRLTPEEVRQNRLTQMEGAKEGLGLEGAAPSAVPEGEMGMMIDEKKEKEFPEANTNTAGIILPISEAPLAGVAPPTEVPAGSQLSPQVYELFEKMVGAITLQHDSGVTTTTVTINMPGSVFNGSQVIIEQYSTAPSAYNIQLAGTPEAVNAFSASLGDLAAAFQQTQYAFETNILKPILQPKKPLIRRKGAAGGKGGGGKK